MIQTRFYRFLMLLLACLAAMVAIPHRVTAAEREEPIELGSKNEYIVFLATTDLPEDFLTERQLPLTGNLRRVLCSYDYSYCLYEFVDYGRRLCVEVYPLSNKPDPKPDEAVLKKSDVKEYNLLTLRKAIDGVLTLDGVEYRYADGILSSISFCYGEKYLVVWGEEGLQSLRITRFGQLFNLSLYPEPQRWLSEQAKERPETDLPLMRTDYKSYRTLADSKLVPEDFIRAEALSDFGDFSAFLCDSYHQGGSFHTYSYLLRDEYGEFIEFSVGVSYGGIALLDPIPTARENNMRSLAIPVTGWMHQNDIWYLYENGLLQSVVWQCGELWVTVGNDLSTYNRTDTLLARFLDAEQAEAAVAEINERITNYSPDLPLEPMLLAAIGTLILTAAVVATVLLLRKRHMQPAQNEAAAPSALSASEQIADPPVADPESIREKPAPDPTAAFPEHTYYADQNPEDWAPPKR